MLAESGKRPEMPKVFFKLTTILNNKNMKENYTNYIKIKVVTAVSVVIKLSN